MNTLWLRRLIRRHDTFGHLVAGLFLLGHYLFVRRPRLALTAMVGICTVSGGAVALLHRATPASVFACPGDAGPAAWRIVDLGPFRGADFVVPYGVNSDDQIVGTAVMSDDTVRAFRWQRGKFQDLGTLGGKEAVANAINDRGQVAGTAMTADGTAHAYVWQDGRMQDLTPERGSFSFANDINGRGQVVGTAYNGKDGLFRAVYWSDGKWKEIGALPGDTESIGSAINDRGEMAGSSTVDYEVWHPFLYRSGAVEPLPTPTGSSFVTGINATGLVVGAVEQDEHIRAYATVNARTGLLPTLGGQDCIAYGVNDSGIVVGVAAIQGGEARACGWQNGKAVDLNTVLPAGSGWQLYFAFGIGSRNQIVGIGIHNRQLRAFLLVPAG